ncbi:AAA family ATPase [uncultured Psychroserpens sp.]|uniref:AAA family ATPase n=1 Tax=uncultured Psychroserpens sp. TaxID=255436 RepID=UPI002606BFAB|nr:AAA family ATPase [uncultured Psychroserpens sp.]
MKDTYDIYLDYNKESNFNNYYLNIKAEESLKYLYNFNSINIFIGANNSGKSRFLRTFMNLTKIDGINNTKYLLNLVDEYNKSIESLDLKLKLTSHPIAILVKEYGETLIDELKFNQSEVIFLSKISTETNIETFVKEIKSNIAAFDKINLIFKFIESRKLPLNSSFFRGIYNGRIETSGVTFSRKSSHYLKISEIFTRVLNLIKYRKTYINKKIYIPTLRSAHSLFKIQEIKGDNSILETKKIREDIFHDTIRKNYSSLRDNIDIFTGLSLYNEIVNVRNSRKEKRNRFHAFERFLRDNFFNGKDIDIIANFNIHRKDEGIEDEDLIEIYIGDNTKSLHNLGDGVQALIILMYKIFLADKNSMVFIDEPELNLHPGYQRLFLEQITSNPILTEKDLTYIIVSHSNHFLDLTLEKDNVSIYSFSSLKKDKFLIRNVNAGDNQMLRDLGVNNSSVFLANSSIWVEGVSDRYFIKAFLLAYCEEYKKAKPREDIDFAFFEYAGSNLVHYNFKKGTNDYDEVKDLITSYALNNRILLLSDLDSGKDAKHNNIEEIAKSTDGFEYKTTKPYREIENLLSDSVWKKVLIEFCNKNDVKKNKANIQKRIDASLKDVKSEKYKSKYIGEFLNDLKITELNKSIYKVNEDKSLGTFIPKAELSQIVLEKVRKNEITWEDFSKNQTIVDLTKSIYDFIEKSKN